MQAEELIRPFGGVELAKETRLYAGHFWANSFLGAFRDGVRRHAGGIAAQGIRFDTERPALVCAGYSPEHGTLLVRRVSYLDVIAAHRSLHREVVETLDHAAREASLLNPELIAASPLGVVQHRGRDGLLSVFAETLSTQLRSEATELGTDRLLPLGVSGHIVVIDGERRYHVLVRRSLNVAVSPNVWALPVEGGADTGTLRGNPEKDLLDEVRDEFPVPLGVEWSLSGVFVPPTEDLLLGRHETRRSGVNLLFEMEISSSAHDFLSQTLSAWGDGVRFYESSEFALAWWDDSIEALHLLRGTPGDDGEWTFTETVLDGHLAETAAIAIANTEGMPMTTATTGEQAGATAKSGAALDKGWESLEDRFGNEQINRFPNLRAVLNKDMRNKGEAQTGDAETLEHIFRVVLQFRILTTHRDGQQIGRIDQARLFEALVYRVSGRLFGDSGNFARWALDELSTMGSDEESVEGSRAGEIIRRLIADEVRRTEDIAGEGLGTVGTLGAVDRDLVQTIKSIGAEERYVDYSRAIREAKLLCFSCALWVAEKGKSTGAADLALEERYRIDLVGEPIALFWKARGLLVSPVSSDAQVQLGFQFIRGALDQHPRNPGMHHTAAIYQIKLAQMAGDEDRRKGHLAEALKSANEAILLDAEWPMFYVTRAKVRRLNGDVRNAIVDIQSGIELARYGSQLDAGTQKAMIEWAELLELWQNN